jgi:peptidylprolyl isomerase
MTNPGTVRRGSKAALLVAVALAGSLAVFAGTARAADGSLSSVTVQGVEGEKPTLQFSAPFKTSTSSKRVITKGTGDTVSKGSKITIDYVVVDGRTGEEVDTSFGAQPVAMPVDAEQVAPVLVKSLVGQKVGSRVLVAIAPKEGLTANLSGSGVKKGDTLLFLYDVKALHEPLARAEGEKVTPADGLPRVRLGAKGKPTITVPEAASEPKELVTQPIIKGAGAAVTAGQMVTVHYTGIVWDTGKQFDSSWDRGDPAEFSIGTGNVIAGWDTGLVGQTVGSQVLLVVPPDQGYGAKGNAQAGIRGTDTLVFVVDILDAI